MASQSFSLRPYQEECIETVLREIQDSDHALVSLPCAAGKTVIFSFIIKRLVDFNPKYMAMILVNQVNLVTQAQEKLLKVVDDCDLGVICGSLKEYNRTSNITIASIQSLKDHVPFLDLLIVDEAHSFMESDIFKKLLVNLKEKNPNIKIIYFTATPYTAKSGYIFGENKEIKKIAYKKTMDEMVKEGYLTPLEFKSTKERFDVSKLKIVNGDFLVKDLENVVKDKAKAVSQVHDALSRLGDRKKVVWITTSIEHAETIQALIRKHEECLITHSKLPGKMDANQLHYFETSNIRHITSVTKISVGYDYPAIDAIVLLRPTRSPVLMVQALGRGMRLFPEKKICRVIDYGGALNYLGHPNDPYVQQPGFLRKKKDNFIFCPACDALCKMGLRVCECGYVFFRNPAPPISSPTKKLEYQAINIDLNQAMPLAVLAMHVDEKYVSKKGNRCFKISYVTLGRVYTEFLTIGSFLHLKFLRNRKKPKYIKVEKVGEFFSVKEKIY